MTTELQLELPPGFRGEDLLRYHLRDNEHVSEAPQDQGLLKGLSWQGHPAVLSLKLGTGGLHARMSVDGHEGPQAPALRALLRRMSGLDQDIAGFEAAVDSHPHLGPLVRRQSGLRVAVTATPFEALAWAILGQQISVTAAAAIRRRFIQAAGLRHSSGLWCHPDALAVSRMSEESLRAAGLSKTKASTLLSVSQAVQDGRLPLDGWLHQPPAELIRERLLALRGIGPWTSSYTLLRGYGWLDGSLHGDVAVRNALGQLLALEAPATARQTQDWLDGFSPWRALAAAHLWASRSLQA